MKICATSTWSPSIPITARDHDDAIFIERRNHGGYRVVVAIADVSHYVREGTALDAEAIARSTSIYLPDRAIPMLPHELSSNLASLVAGKDRLTLAVDMDLTANGQVRSFRYVEGADALQGGPHLRRRGASPGPHQRRAQ